MLAAHFCVMTAWPTSPINDGARLVWEVALEILGASPC